MRMLLSEIVPFSLDTTVFLCGRAKTIQKRKVVDADFFENGEKKSPYSNKDGYLGRGLRLKGPNFHKFKLNFTLSVSTLCH